MLREVQRFNLDLEFHSNRDNILITEQVLAEQEEFLEALHEWEDEYQIRNIEFPRTIPPFTPSQLDILEKEYNRILKERKEAARIALYQKERRDAFWVLGALLVIVVMFMLSG